MSKFSRYLIVGLLIIILVNVFMPHLIATIVTGRYAPGVISGILLNLPVSLYLLWRGFNERIFKIKTLVYGVIVGVFIAIPLLPLLFFVGRIIENIL